MKNTATVKTAQHTQRCQRLETVRPEKHSLPSL